jgi:hypothetical protein
LSTRLCGLISASQRTSSRSPCASSEMQDRPTASKSVSPASAVSTSHRRPRSSTKSPTSGMGESPLRITAHRFRSHPRRNPFPIHSMAVAAENGASKGCGTVPRPALDAGPAPRWQAQCGVYRIR